MLKFLLNSTARMQPRPCNDPAPNYVDIVRFGAHTPLPPKHTEMGKKTYTHLREVIPYKHIPMCFPRQCEIPWIARPPFWVTTPVASLMVGC